MEVNQYGRCYRIFKRTQNGYPYYGIRLERHDQFDETYQTVQGSEFKKSRIAKKL